MIVRKYSRQFNNKTVLYLDETCIRVDSWLTIGLFHKLWQSWSNFRRIFRKLGVRCSWLHRSCLNHGYEFVRPSNASLNTTIRFSNYPQTTLHILIWLLDYLYAIDHKTLIDPEATLNILQLISNYVQATKNYRFLFCLKFRDTATILDRTTTFNIRWRTV